MKDGLEPKEIKVCCPISGHTESILIWFAWSNGSVVSVEHNFCDQLRDCETCRRCGRDIRDFFKENPDWRELTPYVPFRLSPQERE